MLVKRYGNLLVRKFMAEAPPVPRILVTKLDHFGDFVMSVPALAELRHAFPQARIVLICGSWNKQLAEDTGLFTEVRAYDYFPQVAKNWDGVPVQPVEEFDRIVAGRFDLALDFRVDFDTRFLLNRVDAGLRGGIGTTGEFPFLDVALPMAHRAWTGQKEAIDEAAVDVSPDRFTSSMPIHRENEHINNFSVTNTCLLRSPPVSMPLARCQAVFKVGLSGRGFSRRNVGLSFDVLQNGQIIAERKLVGPSLNMVVAGSVVLDFNCIAEGNQFEFRVHATGRPFTGQFTFRGLHVRAVETLLHPRYQASPFHVGERFSLLVTAAADRLRDLYAGTLFERAGAALPPALAQVVGDGDAPIVIAPLSNSTIRDWPLPNYAALIRKLLGTLDRRILVVGTRDQAAEIDALLQLAGADKRVVSLAGQTAWADVPQLLRRAGLVICNNSGIAHLAAACGAPVLAIYSASHQMQEWGPRGRNSRAIMAEVPCSPCGFERIAECVFGHACMTRITPEFVQARAVEVLDEMKERSSLSANVGARVAVVGRVM